MKWSLLNPIFWRLVLASFLALSLVSCAMQGPVKRTVYPDGFLIVTSTLLRAHLEGTGNQRTLKKADSISGREIIYDEVKTQPGARRVPNLLNHGFGVLAMIRGLPDGENTLTLEIQHPPFQMPNGQTRTHLTWPEKVKSFNSRALWDFGYFFNSAYEQTPGRWTLSLKYRDRLIYQESVEVFAATPSSPPSS